MMSSEINLFGIAHVKVDFVPLPKMYSRCQEGLSGLHVLKNLQFKMNSVERSWDFLLKMYSAVFMEVLKAGGKMLRHQIVRVLLLYLGGHPSTMWTFCEPTLDTVLWETIFDVHFLKADGMWNAMVMLKRWVV